LNLWKAKQHPKLSNVEISLNGLKEYTNQPHDQHYLKNELLRDIEDVFPKTTYIGEAYPKKDEKNVYLFEVLINGYKSWLIIKENNNGKKYLYSITDNASVLKFLK
jgi:hypothetical protein